MTKIVFVEPDGDEVEVDAENGQSVMVAAFQNKVKGIPADCGGACSCATCHVYVDDAWWAKVGGPSDLEEAMLDFSDSRNDHSRLSCQIEVTPELEGLRVTVAGD